MKRSPARLYTLLGGAFLLVQGVSTLAFRLYPSLDAAFPALLASTHMMPAHSTLHIFSGLLAVVLLRWGGPRGPLAYAGGFGAFYTGLAGYGWLAGSPTFLHLQPFDHPFHLAFGCLGLLAAGLTLRAGRRAGSAPP